MHTTVYRIKADIKRSYRIAVVADLHDIPCDGLLLEIESKKPDIIIVAGDIVFGKHLDRSGFEYEPKIPMMLRFPNADMFMSKISSIAPTFFTYGNHEWLLMPADIDRIKKAGVHVLHDSWMEFGEFIIGGLSAPDVSNYWVFQKEWRDNNPEDKRGNLREEYFCWKTQDYRKSVNASWLPEFEAQDGYKILMCHHPEYWSLKEPRLENHPIDLVIAGHAHGGQIRIGNKGVYAPNQGFWPKYTSGVHHGKYGKLVISRGLSNPVKVPRLFNPYELVIVELGRWQ